MPAPASKTRGSTTLRRASRPKKQERKKTFTGCWTCRSRKLKCDEAAPVCRQCSNKGLVCAGYGVRLQWLPCSTGESVENDDLGKTKVRAEGGQRRMVVRGSLDTPFTEKDINRALKEIDETGSINDAEILARGPFHVFAANASEASNEEIPSPTRLVSVSPSPSEVISLSGFDWSVDQHDEISKTIFPIESDDDFFSVLEVPDYMPETSENVVGFSKQADSDSLILHHGSRSTPALTNPVTSSSILSIYEAGSMDSAMASPQPYTGLDTYPLEPRFMNSQNRLLIYHYVQNVVDLMATISTQKSPWKAVHLPRALQASGELEATGRTSSSRDALLHAILSCSAYNLASQFQHSEQEDLARAYRIIGQDLFCKSVGMIGNCMQEELNGEKPKYKELLAAMLSMVSIGVMSGNTRNTRVHLEGCESLIRTSKENGIQKGSSKTRALHRIYFYLRVMLESTASTCDLLIRKNGLNSVPTTSTLDNQHPSRMSLEHVAEWLSIHKSDETDEQSFSCEFVYGVPQDLFILIGQSTDLVQDINLFWAQNPDLMLPSDLVSRCDKVEADILNWPLDAALTNTYYRNASPEKQNIIYHQTHAVHKATIIFFTQHVRPMHRYHLQPYVLAVLDHVCAIENIKFSAAVAGGALLWPGFIAASEAVDEVVQKRFLAWLDSVGRKGFGSSRVARTVLLELWSKRKNTQEDGVDKLSKSSWRSVIETRGISLMLT